MDIQNSRVEDIILGLHRENIQDLYDHIRTHSANAPQKLKRELQLDTRTLTSRVACEGIGYLTKTLPKYGKYLDSILMGYKIRPTGLDLDFLRILWPLIELIYQERDGSDSAGALIRAARTFFYLSYKLELPPTQEQLDLAVQKFIEIEEENSRFTIPTSSEAGLVLKVASVICDEMLRGFNIREHLFPRHGPGAVATGERGDEKWVFTHLYHTLHQRFPYYDFMYGIRSNGRTLQLAACLERYKQMCRLPYPVARLCAVPKDSRGPRLISCEPLELQYIQQGVARPLMHHLEHRSRVRYKGGTIDASHHVNFTDQSINGQIALASSSTGEFATIDLSEASDRVTKALFEAIWPEGQVADFCALRSHATLLPSGEELPLAKFAPMGSALCFPVESLLFYCICVASLHSCGMTVRDACLSTYVFGDDIIVPTKYVYTVCDDLSTLGLKVNEEKSCTMGYFRESCGTDAFLGNCVTPVRIRKLPGRGSTSGNEHCAWLAYASHFLAIGHDRSAAYCQRVVETQLGPIPRTICETGYLSVVDPSAPSPMTWYKDVKWSSELSAYTAPVWVKKTPTARTGLQGWDRLNRNLLQLSVETSPDLVVVKEPITQIAKRRAGLMTVPFLAGVPREP